MTRKTHEPPREAVGRGSEFVVVLAEEPEQLQGERAALLDRMLAAIRLDRDRIRLMSGRQFRDAPEAAPSRAVLAFGRELVGPLEEEIVVTRSLEELIAQPSLKREAWSDLQRFARLAGIELPR